MRRKTELIVAGCLELLAIALANWQALGGIRTDEAKYLLNIPYPHPPLMRFVMSLTDGWAFQETFWRLVLATLMVQSVWLVWDMTRPTSGSVGQARKFHLEDRIAVCGAWLLSSAVLVQAGSIMLAPITALEALVFLWLRSRPELCKKFPALIGILWIAALMTTFQAFLFVPIVWNILKKNGQSTTMTALYVLAPVGLLILYSLSNPLALATMVIHGSDGASGSLAERLYGVAQIWMIGGAGVGSVVGTWAIVKSKDWSLIASFILVCAYVTLSVPYIFYAILFTPLFVAGMLNLFSGRRHPHAFPLLACGLFASAIIVWFAQPESVPGPARQVIQTVISAGSGNTITQKTMLISGSFGHEWQYESPYPILRYKPEFADKARAIVCLQTCDPLFNTSGWKLLRELPVEVWVRK